MIENCTRQIVLDTETTGLSPDDGHRIIEIGCVELLNRKITGSRFHVYLNPEREIDAGAIEVHGLSNPFLADKPLFGDVVNDFMGYIDGAELIIHNAPFDIGFLNAELRKLRNQGEIADYCSVLDTLALARKKHPGQRNSLDALCKRYAIDNSQRDLHGALLDAEILAEVYLAMTGGQSSLILETENELPETNTNLTQATPRKLRTDPSKLSVIRCSPDDLKAHQGRLEDIHKASGGRCIWAAFDTPTLSQQ